MSLTEAERRACEWLQKLVEEVEQSGRELTTDELQNIGVHLNLCPVHSSVTINGIAFAKPPPVPRRSSRRVTH